MRTPRPRNYAEVLQVFGDITKFIRPDGTIDPDWERGRIIRIPLPAPLLYVDGKTPITRVACHFLIATPLAAALREIFDAGLWSKLENYGGCYNFRRVRGRRDKLSLHSFGIALDFDVHDNPLGSDGVHDKTGLPTMDPGVVKIFEKYGFFWGGKYQGRKDPMHFQYATGC